MIWKWKDYFTNICDTCGEDLTKEGIVYIIKEKLGVCVECYDSVRIYLIDEEMMPLPDKYRSITSDNADYFKQGEEE